MHLRTITSQLFLAPGSPWKPAYEWQELILRDITPHNIPRHLHLFSIGINYTFKQTWMMFWQATRVNELLQLKLNSEKPLNEQWVTNRIQEYTRKRWESLTQLSTEKFSRQDYVHTSDDLFHCWANQVVEWKSILLVGLFDWLVIFT